MSGNLPRARPALLLPLLLLSAERADSGILGGYELEEEQPVTASEKNLERRLKRRGEAAWKIPLGAALVEDLRWLDGDRIYVSLRLDSAGLENLDHFVVEAGTGAEVWRRARKDDERYSLVHADDAVMLFATDRRKGDRRLIALASDTGEPVWTLPLKKPKNGHHLPPAVVAGAATVAVVDPRRRLVTALRLASGDELWRRRLAKTASPAAALITGAAESYEYVYRPHQRYRSPDDQFVGVDVVHLPTGRHKFNYLSPAYRSYGLWNLVDLERGRVIHHGVGLEPVDYEYSEPRRPAALAPKIRTVKSFLIAAPLRLP